MVMERLVARNQDNDDTYKHNRLIGHEATLITAIRLIVDAAMDIQRYDEQKQAEQRQVAKSLEALEQSESTPKNSQPSSKSSLYLKKYRLRILEEHAKLAWEWLESKFEAKVSVQECCDIITHFTDYQITPQKVLMLVSDKAKRQKIVDQYDSEIETTTQQFNLQQATCLKHIFEGAEREEKNFAESEGWSSGYGEDDDDDFDDYNEFRMVM